MPVTRDGTLRLGDGRTIAYSQYGLPTGRPVVYCHGVPSSRAEGDLNVDDDVVTSLGLLIVVPDRPGLGGSDFQPNRRIIDWPRDVAELATLLGFETFAVVGSSGGAPYAAACGALLPDRVQTVGIVGGLAPADAPGMLSSLSGPLRLMFVLGRRAPVVLQGLLRLNLAAAKSSSARSRARMEAWAPEPDRVLLGRPEIRDAFTACFTGACRQGTKGAALDIRLVASPWGFDPGLVRRPVLLWHGERDRNVPVAHGRYLAGAFPDCRAAFYTDDAHLSVPFHHQRDIFGALAAVAAA
jgi:pimeloyl-ACP methyl ester carboxylesterase